MKTRITIYLLFILSMTAIMGYSVIQSEYHGSGLQPIRNIFKDTISFEEAIRSLNDGHRIRRKKEIRGYTKIIICDGTSKKEKYGSYWVGGDEILNDYCTFSIADVMANDWIVDEETQNHKEENQKITENETPNAEENMYDINWIIGYLDQSIKTGHSPERVNEILLFLAKEIKDLKEKH